LSLSDEPVGKTALDLIQRELAGVDERLWRRLMDVCTAGGPWPITLIGGVGVGKTCAALCMLDRVSRMRQYRTVADLVLAVNNWRRGNSVSPSEGEVWRWWQRAAFTVLDELGARDRVSDAAYEIVKKAIDLRQNKPSVFISNKGLDDLARVYDDRIASRLNAGTVIDLSGWKDRRGLCS